jgi:4-hydroxybenzoate polyprenyltransferase
LQRIFAEMDVFEFLPDNHPMIGTFWAYVTLTHPWAVTIVMIATATFGLLAAGGEPDALRFLLLLTGMLGGQIAIGACNEWRDREADALDKPGRPIPSGRVSANGALTFALAGLMVMVVSGAALGMWGLLLLSIGTGAGLAYNLWFKRTPWSWLPYLVALPLLPTWAWLVMDEFQPNLLWLYPMGAAFVLAIHMSQTLPDIDADGRRGEQGVGVLFGTRWSGVVIWVAAMGSTLAVAGGGWLFTDEPAPALAAAGAVIVILTGAFVLTQRKGARVSVHLFKVFTSCAVILATGWILTVTG